MHITQGGLDILVPEQALQLVGRMGVVQTLKFGGKSHNGAVWINYRSLTNFVTFAENILVGYASRTMANIKP